MLKEIQQQKTTPGGTLIRLQFIWAQDVAWVTSFNFPRNVWMIASAFRMNGMKACIHPATHQRLRLLVVMSQDHNPTQHLWDVAEQEIRIMDVQPGNLQQLSGAIVSARIKTCDECFQHFAESVPSRMRAALKAKESPT